MQISVERVEDPALAATRCAEVFEGDPVAATSLVTTLVQRVATGAQPGVVWLLAEAGGAVLGVLGIDASSGRGALLVGREAQDRAAAPLVRLAREGDVDWLCEWFVGFDRETFDHGYDPEPAVRSKLGHLWVLEDAGRPVAMAAASPAVFGVRRLHAVFTPPTDRGAGHGSAVTAAVVREVIEGGDRAILFADLANPVTVPMYRRLGFDPVETHSNWTIGQP